MHILMHRAPKLLLPDGKLSGVKVQEIIIKLKDPEPEQLWK